MATKQSVQGGWSGIATGVQRSRVPLVHVNRQEKKGEDSSYMKVIIIIVIKLINVIHDN